MKTFVLCLKNYKYLLFNTLNQYTRYTNNQAGNLLATLAERVMWLANSERLHLVVEKQ